jgi:release factor glutamine methyltransferase
MSEWKVREAYMRASSFLLERGVEEHTVSAERLLQAVLGVSRTRLLSLWSDPIEEDDYAKLWALVQRRAAGEPVQYIVGETSFCGLTFRVNRDVLIPRPETELLVERMITHADRLWGEGHPVKAVDVGTGSGAIAVTLASRRPAWQVMASDISTEALRVAADNAARNGVGHQVQWYEGDLLAPIWSERDRAGAGRIDVLVSNPPYIASSDIDGLQREVRDFEPHLALDGGEDGLDLYRRLVAQMEAHGCWPRLVGLEVGFGQAQAVKALMEGTRQWDQVEIVQDFATIERHVIAWQTNKQ